MSSTPVGYYSKELVNTCAQDEKFLLRALQYCQNDSTAPNKRGWYYIDKEGKIQPQATQEGGFSSAQMRAWFEAGYLAPDLPVRHGDNGIYVNVSALGDKAFIDDEGQAFKDALNSIDRVLKLYKE